MSEQLSTVRAILNLLSPVHEAMERGLSERTIERIYEDLTDIEVHLTDVEDELDGCQAEVERVEAERHRRARKPPL